MHWITLVVAGIFETGWATTMKLSEGLARPAYAAATLVLLVASMSLLAVSMRTLPLGVAYAVWTGIGIVGSFAVSALLFHEAATPLHLLCIAAIVGGIVGLRLLSGSQG